MSRENDIKLRIPGVRAVLRTSIKDETGAFTFNKNEKVLVEPLDWDPTEIHAARYRVTRYRDAADVKDDKPESKSEIEIRAQAIFSVDPKKTFRFVEHYRPINSSIFPNTGSPHVDEISQGAIADCTLLAVMQSVLSHSDGAAFVRTMMKDNGDDTTTVRLYHPTSGEPEYFRVNNAVLRDWKGAVSDHKAPWVHILEAAFAARGLKDAKEMNHPVSASAAVYGDGLREGFVMKSIIGVKSSFEKLPRYRLQLKETLLSLQKDIVMLQENYENAYSRSLKPFVQSQFHDQLVQSLFADSRINVLKSVFPKNSAEEIREKIVAVYLSDSLKNKKERNNYRKKYGVDETKRTLDLATASGDPKNKVFSRNYTQHELTLYESIEKGIQTGSVQTTGLGNTHLFGVFGGHAYSVVGVRKKVVKKPNDESTELRFIELRNPWGHVGRKYMQHGATHEIKSDITGSGSFSVELKDFCQYFEGVYSSDASFRFEDAKKTDALRGEIKALMQQPINVDEYSIASLLTLRDTIFKFEKAIIEFDQLKSDLPSFPRELDGYKTALQNRRDIFDIYLCYEANQLNQSLSEIEALQLEIKRKQPEKVDVSEIVKLQVLVSETRVRQLFLQQLSQDYLTPYQKNIQNANDELVKTEGWLNDTVSKDKTLSDGCNTLNTAIKNAFDLQKKRQLSDGVSSVVSSLLRQAKIGQVADTLGNEKNDEVRKVGSLFSKANELFQKLKVAMMVFRHRFFSGKTSDLPAIVTPGAPTLVTPGAPTLVTPGAPTQQPNPPKPK